MFRFLKCSSRASYATNSNTEVHFRLGFLGGCKYWFCGGACACCRTDPPRSSQHDSGYYGEETEVKGVGEAEGKAETEEGEAGEEAVGEKEALPPIPTQTRVPVDICDNGGPAHAHPDRDRGSLDGLRSGQLVNCLEN